MQEMLGKYALHRVLGKGAMGTVYEGFDPVIARRVAIKTVRLPEPDDLEAQDALSRFRREAQAAGRLGHPNIVGVFDYGETAEIAYIVMEFVDGTTLKQVMDRGEVFDLPATLSVMDGLMAGLQYSHERGVVHRDIKPANLMITQDKILKIADFGIARIESSSMTQAGTMLGTPSYMSPEQFMGQPVDARTDLYSSGVLLYQLLTGEKPFDGGLTAIMHKVLNTEPLRPSALSLRVTPALDAVVLKAMAKRPENRYASASEFAAALRVKPEAHDGGNFGLREDDFAASDATVVAARSPGSAPAAAPSRVVAQKSANRLPIFLAGGGIAALAVLGGGAFMLFRHHPAAAPAITMSPVPAPIAAPVTAPAPAMRLADFNNKLGSVPCTLLAEDGAASSPTLSGITGAGTPEAAVTTLLSNAAAPVQYVRKMQPIDGPYCGVLDSIRPYRPLAADPTLTLGLSMANGAAPLHHNNLITVIETMPAFDGYLQTDYFSSDGSVYHLYPTPKDPLKKMPAATVKTLGDPTKGGGRWGAGPPYGTDLIVSIASAQPLFSVSRPQGENAAVYLPALRAALQNAAGGKIAVATVPITTEP